MRPGRRALLVVLLIAVPAVIWPGFGYWLALLGVVAGVFVADALAVLAAQPPGVTRRVSPNVPVNRESTVTLEFRTRSRRFRNVVVADEIPDFCEADGVPRQLELIPGAPVALGYRLLATRRGDAKFGHVVLLLGSPLGLWERRVKLAKPQRIRVYPDFAVINHYLSVVADQQSSRLGIRLAPKRGDGLEFQELRDFREGDVLRQVDWKATARRHTLISREYQEERDQRVLFLIDTGRRMRTKDGVLSHFDHALNAMLLLAYVALRQGDSVALKLFGTERKWVPAQRGIRAVNSLLNETYDLHTGVDAADYIGAAEEVMARQRKRSLIVLMTNLREADEDLDPAIKLLQRRHVVVLANLREQILDVMADHEPRGFAEALQVAGTHRHLEMRAQLQSQPGGVVVDCLPHELPVQIVNAYWRVKRSGRL